MSISIYNVPNHNLNSSMLRWVLNFAADRYSGSIINTSDTSSPIFVKDGNHVSIASKYIYNNNLYLVSAGCLLLVTPSDITSITLAPLTYYYISTDWDFHNDNVTTNVTTASRVVAETYSQGMLPSDISTYVEHNQTIWTADGTAFKIPLFYTTSAGSVVSVMVSKSKASLESFLTQKAVDDMKTWVNDNFTHQSGSTTTNKNYGKIGNYAVENYTLWGIYDSGRKKVFHTNNAGRIVLDYNSPTFGTPVTGVVCHDKDYGMFTSTALSVSFGGTGASTRGVAKTNLGIYYGTKDPNTTPPTNSPVNGDLYFKILT